MIEIKTNQKYNASVIRVFNLIRIIRRAYVFFFLWEWMTEVFVSLFRTWNVIRFQIYKTFGKNNCEKNVLIFSNKNRIFIIFFSRLKSFVQINKIKHFTVSKIFVNKRLSSYIKRQWCVHLLLFFILLSTFVYSEFSAIRFYCSLSFDAAEQYRKQYHHRQWVRCHRNKPLSSIFFQFLILCEQLCVCVCVYTRVSMCFCFTFSIPIPFVCSFTVCFFLIIYLPRLLYSLFRSFIFVESKLTPHFPYKWEKIARNTYIL